MQALLVQRGLVEALKGASALPNSLTEAQKNILLEKAHGTIILSLGDIWLSEKF